MDGGVEYGPTWGLIPSRNPKHSVYKYVKDYFDGTAEKLALF